MDIPVTLTTLTDMNSASTKLTSAFPVVEKGSISKSAPKTMNKAKPPQISTPLCNWLKAETMYLNIIEFPFIPHMFFPKQFILSYKRFFYYTIYWETRKSQ